MNCPHSHFVFLACVDFEHEELSVLVLPCSSNHGLEFIDNCVNGPGNLA